MNRYRVLIVDDQPIVRYGLRALLSTEPDMEVIGETNSGQEAIRLAAELKPDVILMDIEMKPGISGIEATTQILIENSDIAVLIITFHEDDFVHAALRAGARGYLLKDAQPEETMQAIRTVCNGKAIFSPSVMEQVMEGYKTLKSKPLGKALSELSARELEVLKLVAQGLTNKAIAKKFEITPKTVTNHVYNIGQKVGIEVYNIEQKVGIEESDEIRGRDKLIEFAKKAGL